LAILGVLSQSPVEISRGILGEKKIQALPKSWRQIVFFLILSAGSLTPTIDGNTQLSFAGCTISLFGVLINLVQKRNDSQEKIIYGS
jgi:Sec-independent protein secretion pathway component TatC